MAAGVVANFGRVHDRSAKLSVIKSIAISTLASPEGEEGRWREGEERGVMGGEGGQHSLHTQSRLIPSMAPSILPLSENSLVPILLVAEILTTCILPGTTSTSTVVVLTEEYLLNMLPEGQPAVLTHTEML